jgi:hypothetical protein
MQDTPGDVQLLVLSPPAHLLLEPASGVEFIYRSRCNSDEGGLPHGQLRDYAPDPSNGAAWRARAFASYGTRSPFAISEGFTCRAARGADLMIALCRNLFFYDAFGHGL